MTLDEFLDTTPLFFSTLLDKDELRRKLDGQMVELMGAQIVAMVANTGMVRWDEPRRAEEFMPSRVEQTAEDEEISDERRAKIVRETRAMMQRARLAEKGPQRVKQLR
jgi:hypothetical protein